MPRRLGSAPPVGVAGVVGGDEGAFASAVDEGPAVVGFELVVVAAQSVEEVEDGVVGLGPVDAVVDLQVGLGGAAVHRAGGVEPFQGGALVGGGPPAQVGDADDGVAVGGEGGQERVAGVDQVEDGGDRHRPEADHLAHLAGDRVAPQQGGQVGADDHLDVDPGPAGPTRRHTGAVGGGGGGVAGAGGGGGQVGEGVGGVGLDRFPAALGPGRLKPPVGEGGQGGHEQRPHLGVVPYPQIPGSV